MEKYKLKLKLLSASDSSSNKINSLNKILINKSYFIIYNFSKNRAGKVTKRYKPIMYKLKKNSHNSNNQVDTYLNPVTRLNPIITTQNSNHVTLINTVDGSSHTTYPHPPSLIHLNFSFKTVSSNLLYTKYVLDYFGVMFFLENPYLFTICGSTSSHKYLFMYKKLLCKNTLTNLYTPNPYTNLIPYLTFKKVIFKKLYSSLSLKKLQLNFIPIYQNTLVRFIEFTSGNKVLLQFNPFVKDSITVAWGIKYKL
jgi:hypothetical protein